MHLKCYCNFTLNFQYDAFCSLDVNFDWLYFTFLLKFMEQLQLTTLAFVFKQTRYFRYPPASVLVFVVELAVGNPL